MGCADTDVAIPDSRDDKSQWKTGVPATLARERRFVLNAHNRDSLASPSAVKVVAAHHLFQPIVMEAKLDWNSLSVSLILPSSAPSFGLPSPSVPQGLYTWTHHVFPVL